ncbi:hypothetical protein KI688_012908 [Linnemannia hyalina]|uniref:Uncharacterized protein n=1 Tax=Linnemannia hyalina TaxID=64524 RepID=A0A9P7XTS8_9FUNG|nr:hypothetical protein KI688_012908 [Linnemannia hyalina]
MEIRGGVLVGEEVSPGYHVDSVGIGGEVIRQLYQGPAARTRATWFLIRSNPGLVRLSFHKSWSNLKFENDKKPFHPPNQGLYTTPQSMWMSDEAESFLQEMFSTHIPKLRHLEMGHGIEGSLGGDGDGNNSEEDNSNSTTAIDLVTFPRNAVLEWPSVESITISPYKPDPYDLAKIEKRQTWMVGSRSISPLSPFTQNMGDLLDALVRFQGVTHFNGSITLPSADMFRQPLWAFPALTRVECSSQGRGEIFITDTLGGNDYDIKQHPIQELVLRHNIGIGSSQDVESLFFQMPHLVKVEIHGYELDGAAVLEIVRNCRRLRRVWFDLKKPDDYYEEEGGSSLSFRVMVDILVESPETLMSLRGRGHIVLAQDLVESREWGCKEMEELDIEIFGVPRLTKGQEEVLDALSKSDRGIVAKQQQQQERDVDTAEQIRRRLQQLRSGDELTSAEAEALDRRLVSYAVQRKVYQRLGELTQLKRLTFGRRTEYLSRVTPARLDTLEFSLASGLTELGLEKLDIEVFEVPRPTREQEKVLGKLWALDPSWFRATTDGATAVAELQDVELEQARERLRQVGYELTPDEAEALEQRRRCLTQLQQISFISNLDRTTGRQERFDGLEFNSMRSLGGQAVLDHVKVICFSQPKPAINGADYE